MIRMIPPVILVIPPVIPPVLPVIPPVIPVILPVIPAIPIAESPPANPRFFLEGAHEPRGRHRIPLFSAKPDGAPTGDPPPRMGGCT